MFYVNLPYNKDLTEVYTKFMTSQNLPEKYCTVIIIPGIHIKGKRIVSFHSVFLRQVDLFLLEIVSDFTFHFNNFL